MHSPTLPALGRSAGRHRHRTLDNTGNNTGHNRGRRAGRISAVAAAALLTLTGCLQADIGVVLNDDESGEFRVRTVINRQQFAEMEEMFGDFGDLGEGADADPVDPCTEMLEDDMSTDELPEGAVVEPINDGDWCGALATIPFDNLAEFDQLAAEFAESSEDDDTGLGLPSITKTESGYRFSVTGLAMSDESMGMGEGTEGMEGMEAFAEMIAQLVGEMQITYDVRLPGRPVDHNADAVDGNRFQWTLEWGDTRTELFAETGEGEPDGSSDTGDIDDTPIGDDGGSSDGASGDESEGNGAIGGDTDDDDDGSSLTWLWILLGAIVVVGAIVAIVLVNKNKQKGSGTTPPSAPPAGPPTAPPPAPPAGQPSNWQPPTGEG